MSPGLPLDHLTVRPATMADAPAMGACHNICWRQAYRGLLSPQLLAAQDDAARADVWRRALSESTLSESTLSESTLSESTLSESTLSESTLSESTLSESTLSESTLSESAGRTVVVAEMGERLVGLAAAGRTNDAPPVRDRELYALYILRSVYGTGVGQRLFDAAVGVGPCSLWVAAANERAIRFYRRQGFRPDGARKRIEEWEGLPIIRMLR